MKFKFFCFAVILSLPATAQKKNDYPLLLIRDIPASRQDTFSVQAVVTSIYLCPPCPKGAMCKPCIGNHITVMNSNDSLKTQLIIFTNTPGQFTKDKMYKFTLSMRNKIRHEDAELIASRPVPINKP